MKRARNPVAAVERTIDVLRLLKDRGRMGVTDIASELAVSKGTVHNHLSTLEQHGLVLNEQGIYRIGLEFVLFGEYARNQSELYRNGKEPVDHLADETGEYAHLSTEQQGRGIKLYKARGEHAVGGEYQSAKLQNPDPLHHTASGKAILARLPRDEVEEIVEYYGLPVITDHTITSPSRLFDELDRIAERGFALNDEEEVHGIRAVGAPICDPEGRALGSVSVSAPTVRLQGETFHETLPEEVMQVAKVIEARINMDARKGDLETMM